MEKEIDVPVIRMKTATIEVTLKDIFGGDGNTRFQQIETQVLDKKETKQLKRSTMPGLDNSRQTQEIVTRTETKAVETFEADKDGFPILPLGRKIKGTMKSNGFNLARMEHPLFKSMAFVTDMMKMVSCEPEYITLSEDKEWRNNGNYYLATSPQPLRGKGGGSFISKYYDAVKEIKTKIVIKYPEPYDPQIRSIIQLLPTTKTLNRRMTKIAIDDIKYV